MVLSGGNNHGEGAMDTFQDAKKVLDEINQAVSNYDPLLKEKALKILLSKAFGPDTAPEIKKDVGQAGEELRGQPDRLFDSLVEEWNPKTEPERALLACYYFCFVQSQPNATAQSINGVLKDHGLAVSNITRALTDNSKPNPQLVIPVRKAGKGKRGIKLYKITREGIKLVQGKLEGHTVTNT
jgi:hypothetical protein